MHSKYFQYSATLLLCWMIPCAALAQEITAETIKTLRDDLRLQYRELDAAQVKALAAEEKDVITQTVLTHIAEEKQKNEEKQKKFEADVRAEYQALAKDFGMLDADALLKAARDEEQKKAGENKERTGALYLLAAAAASRKGNVTVAADALQRVEFAPLRRLQLQLNMLPVDGPSLLPIKPAQRMEVAETLLDQLRLACVADEYVTGRKALDVVDRYLDLPPRAFGPENREGLARMKTLKDQAKAERKQIGIDQLRYDRSKAGLDANGQPKDGAAAYDVAIYRLHRDGVEGWPAALRLLARCDRAEIAKAATLELELKPKQQPTTAEKIAVAEQWLSAAEAAGEVAAFDEHAARWYTRAASGAPGGLEGLKLSAILKKLQTRGAFAKDEVLPANKWSDLVSTSDPEKNTVHGKWATKNGVLFSDSNGHPASYRFPNLVRKTYNYDLEVAMQITGGNDPSLKIRCPVGEKHDLHLILDCLLNGTSAFESVQGTNFYYDFASNTPYLVSVRIRELGQGKVRVHAAVNGKLVMQWEGAADQMPAKDAKAAPGDIFLSNWNNAAQYAVRIRPVDAEVVKPAQ